MLKFFFASFVLGLVAAPTFAQGTTTLRDPLIPGAQSTAPGFPAVQGMPPPVGSGSTPVGVTPGMSGPPTLLPWVMAGPANNIDDPNSGVNLPVTPAVLSAPGQLGPALTGLVPTAPSTPGADPGMLSVAPYSSEAPAGQLVNVQPGGGLPGVGGYEGSIRNRRRSGQTTVQYERRGLDVSYGGGSGAKGGIQDDLARFGPVAGAGLLFGVPNGNGANRYGGGNPNRISSLDLGGGQRIKINGETLSTGSSLQDFGVSATRGNSIAALNANQSTEYGQGFRNMPIYSSNTTDFGGPYQHFNPANLSPQKTGQRLNPNAIISPQ